MMKKPIFFVALLLAACQAPPADKPEAATPTTNSPVPVIGADRDEHGCIRSAGYRWSIVKNECVRIFEVGIRLLPQDTSLERSSSAFVVFSADKTQAELFLPRQEFSIMMERKGKEGAHSWEFGDLKLFPWKGYVLKEGEKTLYHGE